MTVIANARIVTADEEFVGSLFVRNGVIAEVAGGQSTVAGADDWNGDYLLPGMVEVHTDNLEKHLMPRPKVNWPVLPAIIAHDAQIAASGITTVLDALSVGDIDADSIRVRTLTACSEGLRDASKAGILRADHFLHVRLELAEENLLDMFDPFLHDERLKLVSLMDHTPGQRQWTDLTHYRTYVTGKRGWSEEKVDSMLVNLLDRQQRYADANRSGVVARCMQRTVPVPLATHDDTTVAHVEEGVGDGVTISEFPTTMAAARAARERGLGIIMGAPNLVRGGSHSGNVSAAELARADLLDVLSSDYVPASLLHAAFLLRKEGFSLPNAIATVSRNPALMVGLIDRGEIAPELRADFIRVRIAAGIPVVMGVWKAGRQIA
ncbi:MAG TPA: alpha-D-ribose 1-methylphosphonate 5-triphosphate diphosphatase [Noviherbaspirillum sp.]|jgi:alpha-D-ribose 1-methylphosphonate 5-triphosphate diphosphatase|uniref:alpha-D-ribose 1-methylphosphonate 5-triphosphate diphosphatase n=1 Tax=Noviherbaspirillum sp. TaxID=1926288 RepID=UPI002DDD0F52|nr:alpha-D-ribose 1-methylphosphonate 5-triphosphate diphosphatase [Noviherbaspirillum sp.]HEV2612959.1 alpha-D-ribose 1-methylphosphonate 5-triphosphate diphosphatase [Noviherbaspirillum sp.]